MTITVAKFKDVAEGTQPGQFTIGEREAVSNLDDLDPSCSTSRSPPSSRSWAAMSTRT